MYSSVSSQSALLTIMASVGPSPKVEEALEHSANGGDIGVDLLRRQELSAFVLARRIADLGRTAAHQHDRLVACLLEPAQEHDDKQASNMEARRGRVEADVAGYDLPFRQCVERSRVGQLVDVAALIE